MRLSADTKTACDARNGISLTADKAESEASSHTVLSELGVPHPTVDKKQDVETVLLATSIAD
jgi:hypothetical protein